MSSQNTNSSYKLRAFSAVPAQCFAALAIWSLISQRMQRKAQRIQSHPYKNDLGFDYTITKNYL